jgi:hypothetical protein
LLNGDPPPLLLTVSQIYPFRNRSQPGKIIFMYQERPLTYSRTLLDGNHELVGEEADVELVDGTQVTVELVGQQLYNNYSFVYSFAFVMESGKCYMIKELNNGLFYKDRLKNGKTFTFGLDRKNRYPLPKADHQGNPNLLLADHHCKVSLSKNNHLVIEDLSGMRTRVNVVGSASPYGKADSSPASSLPSKERRGSLLEKLPKSRLASELVSYTTLKMRDKWTTFRNKDSDTRPMTVARAGNKGTEDIDGMLVWNDETDHSYLDAVESYIEVYLKGLWHEPRPENKRTTDSRIQFSSYELQQNHAEIPIPHIPSLFNTEDWVELINSLPDYQVRPGESRLFHCLFVIENEPGKKGLDQLGNIKASIDHWQGDDASLGEFAAQFPDQPDRNIDFTAIDSEGYTVKSVPKHAFLALNGRDRQGQLRYNQLVFAGELRIVATRSQDGKLKLKLLDMNSESGGFRINADYEKVKLVLDKLRQSGLPVRFSDYMRILRNHHGRARVKH